MQHAMRQRAFWYGALIGVLLGLFVAWVVWPVRYTQAYPRDLRQEDKLTYILLVAKDYYRTGDVEALAARLQSFDRQELPDLLAQAERRFGRNAEDAAALAFTREVIGMGLEAAGTAPAVAPPVAPTPEPSGRRGLGRLIPYGLIGLGIAVLLMVIARIVIGARLARWEAMPAERPPAGVELEPVDVDTEEEEGAEDESAPAVSVGWPESPPAEAEEPIPQEAVSAQPGTRSPGAAPPPPTLRQVRTFQSVYIAQAQGRQPFDDVFTIYDEEERTLGECGVGEVETLHNQPGKPVVMEVWLFDKQDTHTHQAYILTPWAYRQPDIREKYEAQGAVVVAQAGKTIRLAGRSLFLEGEIKDVAFAQSGEGDEVLSKLALTLAVYQRLETPSGHAAADAR